MPAISETVRIAKDASALWGEIGRFGAVGAWHPMLASVEADGERPGALRSAQGRDGQTQVERLVASAPDRRSYRYEMASTKMPVANYLAEFQVDDNGDNTSTVRWRAEFDTTSSDGAGTVAAIRAFLRAGLDNLAVLYGKAAGARLLGINHVALEVGDLEAALAFYRRLFDFELRGRGQGMATRRTRSDISGWWLTTDPVCRRERRRPGPRSWTAPGSKSPIPGATALRSWNTGACNSPRRAPSSKH